MCLCVRMLVLEWKERAFIGKVNSRCFCLLVHQYGVSLQSSTKLKGAWNVSANNSETVGQKDLRLGPIVYIISHSFSWLLPLYYYAVISDRTTDICWPPFSRYERNFNQLVTPSASPAPPPPFSFSFWTYFSCSYWVWMFRKTVGSKPPVCSLR